MSDPNNPGWPPAPPGSEPTSPQPPWSPPPGQTQSQAGWNQQTPPWQQQQPTPWQQQPSPWNQQPPPAPWQQQPPQQGPWQQPGPQQIYWQPPGRQSSKAPIVVGIVIAIVLVVAVVGALAALGSGLGTFMEGNTSLNDVAVGQCFDGGRADGTDSTTVVSMVEVKECGEPHESELMASFVYAGSTTDTYEEDALISYAAGQCRIRFGQYVGLSFDASVYGMTYVYPLSSSWLLGDRSIQCIAHPPAGRRRWSDRCEACAARPRLAPPCFLPSLNAQVEMVPIKRNDRSDRANSQAVACGRFGRPYGIGRLLSPLAAEAATTIRRLARLEMDGSALEMTNARSWIRCAQFEAIILLSRNYLETAICRDVENPEAAAS